MLDKHILLKVIQAVIFSIDAYEQDTISVGEYINKNKKYRWNYFHNISMLSLLGANYCLHLFHIAKHFIWINETINVLIGLQLDI